MLLLLDEIRVAYPGAGAGVLVMRDVANPTSHPAIDRLSAEMESQLRSRFAGGNRAIWSGCRFRKGRSGG